MKDELSWQSSLMVLDLLISVLSKPKKITSFSHITDCKIFFHTMPTMLFYEWHNKLLYIENTSTWYKSLAITSKNPKLELLHRCPKTTLQIHNKLLDTCPKYIELLCPLPMNEKVSNYAETFWCLFIFVLSTLYLSRELINKFVNSI